MNNEEQFLNPMGPIKYPQIKVMKDNEGIQAKPFNFKPREKPESWQAQWIWLKQAIYPEYQNSPYTIFNDKNKYNFGSAFFRKKSVIEKEISDATAWVSGDARYRLYINGKIVARGPAEAGGDFNQQAPMTFWYYDYYDFSSYLHKGENIIVAEVVLQTDVAADLSMGHGGFIMEINISHSDRTESVIRTDSSWKGIRNPAFITFQKYDARKEPEGWYQFDYDDIEWPFVDVFGKPPAARWQLKSRQIPPRLETRINPKSIKVPFQEYEDRFQNMEAMLKDASDEETVIKPGAPLTFWIDFGKEIVGYVQLVLEGEKGTRIKLKYQEIIGTNHRTETYIMKEGLQRFEVFRLNGFRYLEITVSKLQKPLSVQFIGNNFTSYPDTYRGDFACSEPLLNQIWKVGRWTNQLCRQGYELDSPVHQEPLSDPGDYLIESMINYYTFGDPWLTRQDILRINDILKQKDGVMFHTSYSLLWIQMITDYYDYTGDKVLINKIASTVYMLLSLFENYLGESGLIENSPNFMFMDWVEVDEFNLHHPPRIIGQGYLTAFYYKALCNGIRICDINNAPQKKVYFTRLAQTIKKAFNKELWVEERGLYCDGKPGVKPVTPSRWQPADVDRIYFSQHTNALAVLYDLTPPEKQQELIKRIMEEDDIIKPQPYFMYFLIEAIAHADLFSEYGLDQIRRWQKLLEENSTSWKEVWGSYGWQDYSHAWSGCPTYHLSSKVLGVTPLQPGFKKVEIKPVVEDLEWARGLIPVADKTIKISWEQKNNEFRLEVKLPSELIAQLVLPSFEYKKIKLIEKGIIIWQDNTYRKKQSDIIPVKDKRGVIFELKPGNYTFSCQLEEDK